MRLLAMTVFAAAGDGDKDATPPLHLEHLSLYVAPAQQKSRYVEPEAGQLEKSVTTLRKLVEPHTDWCKVTYDKFKSKVQSVVRCGNDAYDYFKNPRKDFYPRAGIIGLTGILGFVLARGSRIKKLMYPAGLMTVSASLYYPEQAAVIFKSTGDTVYERAVQTYAAVEKILKPASRTEEGRDSETKPRGPQWDIRRQEGKSHISKYCILCSFDLCCQDYRVYWIPRFLSLRPAMACQKGFTQNVDSCEYVDIYVENKYQMSYFNIKSCFNTDQPLLNI